MFKVKCFLYGLKGLDTRKTHANYNSSVFFTLKDMVNARFLFHRHTNEQTDGQG